MFRKKERPRADSDGTPCGLLKAKCSSRLHSVTDINTLKSLSDDDLSSLRPQVANVCLLGDENVGKSSLSLRIAKGSYKPDYLPTIGGHSHSVVCGTYLGRSCHLCVRDVSGNSTYRSVIHKFIRGADVLVLVFDLTSRKSFENLPSWKTFLTNLRIETAVTFVLCGNKADLVSERQVSRPEIKAMSRRLDCSRYLETSAKNNICIKELKDVILNNPDYSDDTSISSNTSRRFKRSAWQNKSIIRRTASSNGIDGGSPEEKTKVQVFFFPQSV